MDFQLSDIGNTRCCWVLFLLTIPLSSNVSCRCDSSSVVANRLQTENMLHKQRVAGSIPVSRYKNEPNLATGIEIVVQRLDLYPFVYPPASKRPSQSNKHVPRSGEEVCKTSIRRFESARRLHIALELEEAPEESGAFSRLTADLTATGIRFGVSWPVYTPLPSLRLSDVSKSGIHFGPELIERSAGMSSLG